MEKQLPTPKNILIIEASDDICSAEIVNIMSTAVHYGLKPHHCKIKSMSDLRAFVEKGIEYDYIYLCAHADRYSFGSKDGELQIRWKDFALLICETNCVNDNTIFLLACCRSGLNQVAYELFYHCDFIEFICGPTWFVSPQALTLAFNVFLFHVEHKGNEPTEAAKRMSDATGNNFTFFDKVRTEVELSYIKHVEAIESSGLGKTLTIGMRFNPLNQKWEPKEPAEVDSDKVNIPL